MDRHVLFGRRWWGRRHAVRFRRSDWDIPMPDVLVAYWMAWNEPDLDKLRGHLESAVEADVTWNDPRDSFVGIDELERGIRRLRTTKPDYSFAIVSEIDCHHQRLRYRWDMFRGERTLMEGLDVVTLGATTGRICRVDGFFGEPTMIGADTGIPEQFRRNAGWLTIPRTDRNGATGSGQIRERSRTGRPRRPSQWHLPSG
jgi:SnoaL-like domain